MSKMQPTFDVCYNHAPSDPLVVKHSNIQFPTSNLQHPISMSLTRNQVTHIAELAKLELTEQEIERMLGQLSAVLEYAERLNELDTDAIAPTASVIPNQNVMRADVVTPSLTREQVLQNAPDTDANHEFLRVRAILED